MALPWGGAFRKQHVEAFHRKSHANCYQQLRIRDLRSQPMRTPVMSRMPKGGMTRHSQRSWHSWHSLVPPFLLTFVDYLKKDCISLSFDSAFPYIPNTFPSQSDHQIQSDPISVSGPRWKRQKQYCSAGRPFEGICQGTAQHTLCRSCASFVSVAFFGKFLYVCSASTAGICRMP